MPMSVKYEETACKRVLDSFGIVGTRFWTRHCFDPYGNCEFNCVYCNSGTRRHKQFRGSSNPVYVKLNAPQVLARELARLKRKGVVSMGVAVDPYQPAERRYRITQQILEVLKEHSCPFAIGTKSDLILRDLNLISEASEKSWCCVSLSITTLDENLAKLLEPNAPYPKRRLETVKRLSDQGITAGIWLAPIIPYVTDSNENIAGVVEAAVESGAKFVLGVGLDMRDPIRFKMFLEEHFAWLIPRYERLYKGSERPSTYYPDDFYLYGLYRRFISMCQRYGVESYIPHFHTRRQAWLFYVRNFLRFNGTPIFEFTQLLNYLSPSQEFLQTVQIRLGHSGLSKGILKTLRYFPH
jgi:DNA repair photolyase